MVVLFREGSPSPSPPISNSGKMRASNSSSSNRAMYRLVPSVASEAMGLGKSTEVLTVLGGKASCRRKFVLNLHLVDDYGCLVSRDLAIVASVAYAHDHSPVVRDEKPFLAEPPLFTTFNGVEFPAQDRPTRMVSGRASFKLAISLLSSKCDNRLFCICFTPQPAPGETSPICSPCYSKPIRSISRKRTQSASISHVSSSHGQPLLLLATTLQEATTPSLRSSSSSMGFNFNTSKAAGVGSVTVESESLKYSSKSPGTSNEKDGEGPDSPVARLHVQGCSQSSSVTSMHHYLSPRSSAGLGIDDSFQGGMCRRSSGGHGGGGGALLVLQESASRHGVGKSLGSLSGGRGDHLERCSDHEDTDHPSGSSSGNCNMAASISISPSRPGSSCSPVDLNGYEPPIASAVPCSLSLRLSPSDSDSPTSRALTPTSGALTSGRRSFYNNNNVNDRTAEGICTTNSSSLAAAIGSSIARPFSAPSLPTSTGAVRPFRPYGSMSSCKVSGSSVPDFKLGPAAAFSLASMPHSDDTSVAPSTHNLLERVQQLRAVSPGNSGSKVDQILHNFSISTRSSEEKVSSALTEISLDEEEKSLQYIEVSLQEVSRDVQRRKEELRSKRRRLLEDEARMHSIVFQSSSWIESLSGRFSL